MFTLSRGNGATVIGANGWKPTAAVGHEVPAFEQTRAEGTWPGLRVYGCTECGQIPWTIAATHGTCPHPAPRPTPEVGLGDEVVLVAESRDDGHRPLGGAVV